MYMYIQMRHTYIDDCFESKLESVSLFGWSEGSRECSLGGGRSGAMWITHPRHPAADHAAEVRAKRALDLVHARLESLVAGLSHSVVIILRQEGGRG